MKRCPECYETYGDEAKFCEADGHDLLADPTQVPKPEIVVAAAPAQQVWWPAAALGVLIGLIVGAGVFMVAFVIPRPQAEEKSPTTQGTEVPERVVAHRAVIASSSLPTPEPEASPSPSSEVQAAAEQSPTVNAENKKATVQLNQGPISTGSAAQKSTAAEGEATGQVIEMTDGSKLDVDAAWQDNQGIWYRRSGLVSFVDSSRVKSITARRDTKVTEEPHP